MHFSRSLAASAGFHSRVAARIAASSSVRVSRRQDIAELHKTATMERYIRCQPRNGPSSKHMAQRLPRAVPGLRAQYYQRRSNSKPIVGEPEVIILTRGRRLVYLALTVIPSEPRAIRFGVELESPSKSCAAAGGG